MTDRAVCFDLDDTLYDYRDYARAGIQAAAAHLEDEFDIDLLDELEGIYFGEGRTDNTFDVLCRRAGLPHEVVEQLVEAFHGASTPLEPFPEVPGVLGELEGTYRLGLVTDGRGGHAKLDRLGLDGRFDTVFVTPQIGHSKASPKVFRQVLSALSVPPERATYVGDDPRIDFRVPNSLGMGTVRVRRGRYVHLAPSTSAHEPNHEISSLRQLPEVLPICES